MKLRNAHPIASSGAVTSPLRSHIMRSVRRTGTAPELLVRKAAAAMGLRYRPTKLKLIGSPDLVFAKRKLCIFVHGCFWHRHIGCRKATIPKSNQEYWCEKFEANVKRDARAVKSLRKEGWRVLIIWECQSKKPEALIRKLQHFIDQHEGAPPSRRQKSFYRRDAVRERPK